jgi:hypothetical protein
MCFSFEMSATLAVFGWVSALALWACDGRSGKVGLRIWGRMTPLCLLASFYATMETLQAAQYLVADRCGTWTNWVLACAAHVLVVVQPAMWNGCRMVTARAASPPRMQASYVFAACMAMSIVWAVAYTMRLAPSVWMSGAKKETSWFIQSRGDIEIMVGSRVCTGLGPTHIVWSLPYAAAAGLEPNLFTYLLLWLFPVVYEPQPWLRLTFWIVQIISVTLMTRSVHEWPTVWCMLSVPMLGLAIGPRVVCFIQSFKPRLRQFAASSWRSLCSGTFLLDHRHRHYHRKRDDVDFHDHVI